MNGLWFLALLILVAGLPVIPAWFAFRLRKLDGRLFLLSLAAGLLSVPAAVFLQSFFPPAGSGRGAVMFGVFIRIALVEELSRLLTLFPLSGFAGRPLPGGKIPPACGGSPRDMGAMTGFAAGLGFAAAESGFYGSSDIGIALLRVFTAAPLHGACGARAGAALSLVRQHPIRSASLFVSAVLIHGIYDLFIISPGLPSFLSILIALAALGSSLLALYHGSVTPQ
ncbi:MAG: PrsW family intramembrane metalloprotease [Treponema sp.]|jgi:RsiW-degrading membrane proteinase PrsW (M82 family)|nr:PrsW family intramembrane metalloprotease [Treponema sp.]